MKYLDHHKKCLGRHQKIQETIERERERERERTRVNQEECEKLNYSSEVHQRVLPPNIVVKIE